MNRRLTACERECIIGATDDEQHWRVYVDVPSRFVRRFMAVARAWGVTSRCVGNGAEFELPLRAIRFARPPRALTEAEQAQRRQAAAASQKARNSAGNNGAPLVSEGSPARNDAEVPRRPSGSETPAPSVPENSRGEAGS